MPERIAQYIPSFQAAELKTRELLRRLGDMSRAVSMEERELVEKVRGTVSEIHTTCATNPHQKEINSRRSAMQFLVSLALAASFALPRGRSAIF